MKVSCTMFNFFSNFMEKRELTEKEFQKLRSGDGGGNTSMGGVLIFKMRDGVHIAYQESDNIFWDIIIKKRDEFKKVLEKALRDASTNFMALAEPVEAQMFD